MNFPPPILFVIGVFTSVALQRAVPLCVSDILPIHFLTEIGCALIIMGSAALLWGLVTFRRAQTAIYPNQPARRVIVHGPYRFSRNPMYCALIVLVFGISFAADNLWMLLLLPIVLIALTYFVIRHEEAYLRSAFGREYIDYCDKVRRWI